MTPERKALLDQIGMHWTLRADESECPAAAIISELLPRKKPAVKLDRRFFLWMHLAFPCKCQRMCLDKSVSKDNIVKNFEKVHWEGACKE